jgi:hypothetical protein
MRRIPWGYWSLITVAVVAAAMGSCGGEATEDAPEPLSEAPTETAANEIPLPRAPDEPEPVTLEAVNQSGVEGRATAIERNDSIQFNLMVQGLPGAGEYTARIHQGSCQTGGDVLVSLSPVHAESDGMGRSMTTLGATRLPDDASHFVQVLGSRGVLACGDVPRPMGPGTARIP